MRAPIGRWATLVFVAGALAGGGCGSSNGSQPTGATATTIPPPVPSSIVATGSNWSFRRPGSGAGQATLTALEGAFNASGSPITAVLEPYGDCFFHDIDRVRFAGNRSGSAISLQSQPIRGQVVEIAGTLTGSEAFSGTWSITGGCGNGTSGTLAGAAVDVSGTWRGKLGAVATVFELRMAGSPDADGNYGVSGTARFSGTGCFPDATITRRGRGRIWFPDVVGATQRLELIVQVSDDLQSMVVDYVLVEGTCPELAHGAGRLDRE